jgi:hypothetical protein
MPKLNICLIEMMYLCNTIRNCCFCNTVGVQSLALFVHPCGVGALSLRGMHTDLMATSFFLKKIDFENSSADKCNTSMQQRPHHPVRPIPSQLWCKNFGKKEYWSTFELVWHEGTLLLPSFCQNLCSAMMSETLHVISFDSFFSQWCYMRSPYWTQINWWLISLWWTYCDVDMSCYLCPHNVEGSLLYMWWTDQVMICL